MDYTHIYNIIGLDKPNGKTKRPRRRCGFSLRSQQLTHLLAHSQLNMTTDFWRTQPLPLKKNNIVDSGWLYSIFILNRETRLREVYMIRADGGYLSRGWGLSPAGSIQRLKPKPRYGLPSRSALHGPFMMWDERLHDCIGGSKGSNWAEVTTQQETIIDEDAKIKCSDLLSAILWWERGGYGMSGNVCSSFFK